jgi:CheY-like chemotaxis protein
MTDAGCARTVLIVEDDVDTRSALAEVLEDGNYRLLTAENGKIALDELRAAPQPPCVILLDVMMPVMDGREFRVEQEKDPALSNIPVVVLSAHADAVTSAAQMRAAGFLKKPVDLHELLRTVEQFCVKD